MLICSACCCRTAYATSDAGHVYHQVLAAGQSLASYGIGAQRASAVLELVPLPLVGGSSSKHNGCGAAASGKPGSPPLSSPEHGLFANWQAAQAGLASGLMPQLAPSGSGGSYFLRGADGECAALHCTELDTLQKPLQQLSCRCADHCLWSQFAGLT